MMTTHFGNLYLGNKMRDKPFLNAIWFDSHTILLRRIPGVDDVFNPAQHDRDQGYDPMLCPAGSIEEARAIGFDIRKALGADLNWIENYSNGMVVGEDWNTSPGTITEIAFHQAIGLPVWPAKIFLEYNKYGVPEQLISNTTNAQLPDLRLSLT